VSLLECTLFMLNIQLDIAGTTLVLILFWSLLAAILGLLT